MLQGNSIQTLLMLIPHTGDSIMLSLFKVIEYLYIFYPYY